MSSICRAIFPGVSFYSAGVVCLAPLSIIIFYVYMFRFIIVGVAHHMKNKYASELVDSPNILLEFHIHDMRTMCQLGWSI